jgi:hypothetical protein
MRMMTDWTEDVEEFAELRVGENTFEITGEPHVEEGKYGKRLHVPTNIGVWRISILSPIARELKKVQRKNGSVAHVSLTIAKTGKDKDTRYSIVNMVLPHQRRHEVPPSNQTMLNLEELTEEQKQQLQQILNQEPKEQ